MNNLVSLCKNYLKTKMEFANMEVMDIERICRTCLCASDLPLESINTEDDCEKINYAAMMKETFGKNLISQADGVSYKICSECQDIIKRAYNFMQKCQKSNIALTGIDLPQNTSEKDTQTDSLEVKQDYEKLDDDDENFDSINLQSEDSIFENQSNPLLDINPVTAQDSVNVNVKTENEPASDNETAEEDDEADIMDQETPSPIVVIKTEHGEDLICDVNPFNAEESESNKKELKLKNHNCEKCFKSFSRLTHLRRHALIHEEVRPIQCSICEKSFTRMDHLKLHEASNHSESKPFHCDHCKKGFIRKEHLIKHVESKHGDGASSKNKEICTICQKSFSSKKYLRVHQKTHSGTDKGLSCKYCGKLDFHDKNELNDHISRDHHNEKAYLCSECGMRFVRNDYLVIHMRRHLNIKPYKCRFCDKGFPRATDLTVHERYHTNEKTHLCNLCGKGFQRAYNLLVHMRVHTGEKPYACNYCSKSFAQGNDLKAHIRRHTGERFKCEICQEGFIQGYHLTHHKRTVHGLDVKSHIRRVEKFPANQNQTEQLEEAGSSEQVKIETEFQVNF